MGVEIHPVYSIDILNEPFGAPRPGSSGTLTGAWAANDEGTYYLRQVNNSVWWLGLSRDRGGSFANVFHGMIQGNTVAGDWADVPIGSVRNSGRLTLLGAGGGASTTKLAKDAGSSTPGFGGQLWEKLYDQPPIKREMAVTIRGDGAITVPLDPGETSAESAVGEYRIVTQDLRPPLQILWTASNGSTIENPNGASTRITFDIAGTRPGQTVRKGIVVHVTDADNRSAQSRLGISIRVITQR
jgi:hypothetical protein